jgi:hypothetical protein
MPIALFLLIALYMWLVWQRTRGDKGKALVGEGATKAEKLIRFVRVGLVVASVVLVATIIVVSSRQRVATPVPMPAPVPDPASGSWLENLFADAGRFFGVESQGAALPFFVIIGTAVSYGYTIVAVARVIGYYRWMRQRKRLEAPAS